MEVLIVAAVVAGIGTLKLRRVNERRANQGRVVAKITNVSEEYERERSFS